MAYLEELLPEFRKGAKIRKKSWEIGTYIYYKDGKVYDNNNESLYRFTSDSIFGDEWELYKEPEPDWESIIDNRCLCYFWDEKFNWAMYGTLGKIEKGGEYRFTMFDDAGNRSSYKHCRPVRRDEVTFYEYRKDA